MLNISFISKDFRNERIRAISIGKFDGVHIAHAKLLALLPQDGAALIIDNSGEYLTSLEDRDALISQEVYVLNLQEIRYFSAEEFINLLMDRLPNLERIIVGYDFVCSQGRRCDAKGLSAIFKGEVEIMSEVLYEGFISVHSKSIRAFLESGNIKLANALLGRRYSIKGELIRGQGLGGRELFATYNVKVEGYILPKEGVYAGLCNYKNAAIFIGKRSSDNAFAIEAHSLDGELVLDSKIITLEFVEFIRENVREKNLASLKRAISDDIVKIKHILQAER